MNGVGEKAGIIVGTGDDDLQFIPKIKSVSDTTFNENHAIQIIHSFLVKKTFIILTHYFICMYS